MKYLNQAEETRLLEGIERLHEGLAMVRGVIERTGDDYAMELISDTDKVALGPIRSIRLYFGLPLAHKCERNSI